MTDAEQRALLGLCLLAAFADGNNSDLERNRVREIVEGFKNPGLKALDLYRDVLLRRVAAPELARQLVARESKLLAYEMALGVCEADNLLNEVEKAFLAQLRQELGLDQATVAPLHAQADELVAAAVPPLLPGPAAAAGPAAVLSSTKQQEVESTILNHAILAGALELLPSSLASMAIIPLQMRLVYRIGQEYGHPLDRRHIGEFLAAAGIGMGSQVLEGYVTKFARGLLGKVAGGLGRGLAGAFTGSAMSFATTWALGQLAHKYYAGGRSLSGMQLQETYQSLVGQAKGLQQQYLPQIQQRARGLNLADVARLAGRS